jgi:hypothetical protein
MDRYELILAAFAAGGENSSYRPVQAQKLMFLVDREISALVNGPYFKFEPYDYGPFDREVYVALDDLVACGLVTAQSTDRYRVYSLSSKGFERGQEILWTVDDAARTYLEQAAKWVLRLTFQQLVSAIYKRYPDMRVNSIFRE